MTCLQSMPNLAQHSWRFAGPTLLRHRLHGALLIASDHHRLFQQQVLSSFLWQVLSVAWASYPLWWYTICRSENGWYTPQNGDFSSGNGDLAMDGMGYPIFRQIQICCDVSQPLLAARIPLALHAFRCWNVLHRGRFKEEMLDALPTSGYPVLISIVSHSRIWTYPCVFKQTRYW